MIDNSSAPLVDLAKLERVLRISNQNMSQLIQTLQARLATQANLSALGLSYSSAGGTTVVIGGGQFYGVATTAVSSASADLITIYDSDSPANVGSSNAMAAFQLTSLNEVLTAIPLPFSNGLTVQLSSLGGTASIYYRVNSS